MNISQKNNDFLEAEKVVICPANERITLYPSFFEERKNRRTLIGKIVNVGDLIQLEHSELSKRKFTSGGAEFDDYDDSRDKFDDFFDGFHSHIYDALKVKILKTIPEGKVKITGKTKIELIERLPNEDGIPVSSIITIKKLPDLKNYTEVTDTEQIIKIANSVNSLVDKFENEQEVVYVVGHYYYVKKK